MMTIKMVRYLARQFKEERTEVHVYKQASTPSEAITDNVITVISAITEGDHCVMFPAIPHNLQENHFIEILQGPLHTIIYGYLNLRKLSVLDTKGLDQDHRKDCPKSNEKNLCTDTQCYLLE